MTSPDAKSTELYQRAILDHNKSPRCYGDLAHPTHQAKGYNPICGDVVHVSLSVASDRVHVLQFTAQSCALCKASASIMCEALQTKTVFVVRHEVQNFLKMLQGEGIEVLPELTFFSAVRDFPARAKCVMLPWKTLFTALTQVQVSLDSETVVSTEV